MRDTRKNPYTYDECIKVAKECSCRWELQKRFRNYYCRAFKMGWINDYIWLARPKYNKDTVLNKEFTVYSYVFEDLKTAYVGLTINMDNRAKDHARKNTSVSKFYKKNGIDCPSPIVHYTNLTAEEGRCKEKEMYEQYKQQGYTMLNVGRIGKDSSIGTLSYKWDYDATKKESLKYDRPSKFAHGSAGAYDASVRNGWIKDFTWLYDYLSYDYCYRIAKKCSSRVELSRNHQNVYCKAVKKKWINDYDWFVQLKNTVDYEAINIDSFRKDSSCMTVAELSRKYKVSRMAVYKVQKQHGIMQYKEL